MPTAPSDLIHGTLDLLILRALTQGRMHGYAVARLIRERSRDAILVEEGALYPALHRLSRKGWIAAEWGLSENNRKAKYYELTPRGRLAMRAELAGWRHYVDAVTAVIQPA